MLSREGEQYVQVVDDDEVAGVGWGAVQGVGNDGGGVDVGVDVGGGVDVDVDEGVDGVDGEDGEDGEDGGGDERLPFPTNFACMG